jgi:FkbM family methyltransferase
MSLFFRPNTWDANIWNSIVNSNEYGIVDDWSSYVIDIGGHIGSFSYFITTQKKAKKVITIEPDPDNFRVLQHNLDSLINEDRVYALNAGIGPKDTNLSLFAHVHENTGGVSYVPSENGAVPTVSLDDLIRMVPENEAILLKLDCEGCEYEALGTCSQLHRINAIVGEFHHRGDNNQLTIKNILENNNFTFSYHHTSSYIGLFGAHRVTQYSAKIL